MGRIFLDSGSSPDPPYQVREGAIKVGMKNPIEYFYLFTPPFFGDNI